MLGIVKKETIQFPRTESSYVVHKPDPEVMTETSREGTRSTPPRLVDLALQALLSAQSKMDSDGPCPNYPTLEYNEHVSEKQRYALAEKQHLTLRILEKLPLEKKIELPMVENISPDYFDILITSWVIMNEGGTLEQRTHLLGLLHQANCAIGVAQHTPNDMQNHMLDAIQPVINQIESDLLAGLQKTYPIAPSIADLKEEPELQRVMLILVKESQNPQLGPTGRQGLRMLIQAASAQGLFQQLMLRRADLRNLDLRGIDFSSSCVDLADFSGCDLRDANLSNSLVFGTKFRGADLRKTKLLNCRFEKTDFSGANLSGLGTTIEVSENMRFYQLNFNAAILNNSDLANRILERVNLKHASMENCNLTDSVIYDSSIANANLSNSNLMRAYILHTDFRNAKFDNANLTEAQFIEHESDLDEIYLREISGVKCSDRVIPNDYMYTLNYNCTLL